MGALRLYRRGWARTCDSSGTATRSEFWWFTAIHAVVYPVALIGSLLLVSILTESWRPTYDFAGFVHGFCTFLAVSLVMLAPWTSLLVRRVRDSTGSTIAALVIVVIAYGGLISLPFGSAYSTSQTVLLVGGANVIGVPLGGGFTWIALLAFAAVVIVCALPSRGRDTQALARPAPRSEPENEHRESNDVLRLYGRGWAKIWDYSGTATRSEFWSFTVINAIIYAVLAESFDLTGFLYLSPTINVVTVVILLPWTPLLVRRVRDATGSENAAGVSVLVAYGSLIAASVGIASLTFLLLAVLGLLTVAIICASPSREPGTAFLGGVMARPKLEPEQSEDDAPWAR